jgi:putative serine protease PepD
MRTGTVVAVCVVVALLAAAAAAAITWWLVRPGTSTSGTSTATTECDAVALAEQVMPTVVTINVTNQNSRSNGTGEVIRSDGYILTNDHVIDPGVDGGSFSVVFSSGESLPATVVGRAIGLDLAVIKVGSPKPLPVIAIGSSAVPIGLPVVALGSPLGLEGSVTRGIVSALGRDIALPAAGGTTALISQGIQTDAAINPGNSGGPLVNCAGEMIGVNTAIATVPDVNGSPSSGSVGIGFAIPSDLASGVADQLIANGKYTLPSFGMSVVPVTREIAQQFGLPPGLYVLAVTPDGGAEAAGIKEGDVVTSVDGHAAFDETALIRSSLAHQVGDRVPVTYYRDGKSTDTTVTLG